MFNDDDWNKKIRDMLLIIIFNWDIIEQNENIMKVLNMDENKMCKTLKYENPDMMDSLIQGYVFTMLIVIKCSLF
jgi:DnaJ-domain-containing protein 1